LEISGRFKSRRYGRRSSRKDEDHVEERVNGSFYETPEPYAVFSCSDGLAARVAANRRGLVAFYLGERKRWSLVKDQRVLYDYLAIPSGLAERLAMGALMDLDELDAKARSAVLRLYAKGVMTLHEGRKRRYQLTHAGTIDDFRRQLRYINGGGKFAK